MPQTPGFAIGGCGTCKSSTFTSTGKSMCSRQTRRPNTSRIGWRAQLPSVASENEINTPNFSVYSTKGMSVEEFFAKSHGDWKSQRSSHNLAWAQFEAVTSEIKITPRNLDDSQVLELCDANKVGVEQVALALAMEWEGESDWDDDTVMKGSTVMAVVKDSERTGRLLRSMGYAEEIPAVGQWEMTPDGVFVLVTPYEAAAAEERIWFATDDLRMRVSQIRTSSGRGVVTASFSSEIRKLQLDK